MVQFANSDIDKLLRLLENIDKNLRELLELARKANEPHDPTVTGGR